MCGQLTAYNTYATLSYTKPLFLGFFVIKTLVLVLKEIIQPNIKRTSKPLEIQYFQGFIYVSMFAKSSENWSIFHGSTHVAVEE